jgi:hypothetical protein
MQLRSTIIALGLATALTACNGNSGTTATTSAEDSLKALQPDTSAASRDSAFLAETPQPEDSAQTPATTPAEDPKAGQGQPAETKSGDRKAGIYRFTVSFYSPGNGIDHTIKGKYDTFVTDFGKRKKVKLEHETVSWGREGEVDYCFFLRELSEADQKAFVKESKALLAASERVNTAENTTCRQPRR